MLKLQNEISEIYNTLTNDEKNIFLQSCINVLTKIKDARNKVRTNQKTKTAGNGEGSLYYSEKQKCWVYQYYDLSRKRKTIKQKKNETVKHFKSRVAELRVHLNNGTYIEKNTDTTKIIIENHINQKFTDKITNGNSYTRNMDTLKQLEISCSNFLDKPIQSVNLRDIQIAKETMKNYSQSCIDKQWQMLKKAFSIASSPSIRLIPFNLMTDENLIKPISNLKTKKVFPLEKNEREKLNSILDNEEKEHKYRDIVKIEWLTSMRIGEVLARSKDDIQENESILHIHNTLTKDKNGIIILGKHTKTYDKKTGIDKGERKFPIDGELKDLLIKQLDKKIVNMHGLLFWDYEENRFVSEQNVNTWLKRINKKYNISKKELHNHRLRHDRITQWKESGMDMKAIQYLAGHVEGSDITDNYIDVSHEFAVSELKKAQ